ncbi:hypothetical protein [Floccifex sp.]|uniref:hypothetical protein n=1 Tax=Floccifex sp. TaxID=2815810 RepID=UPI003F080B42
MKNKLGFALSAALAFSMPLNMTVLAEEVEQETIEIKNANDFKEQFLCYKVIEIKNNKEETSYILFENIDESNYEVILAGKRFLETLNPQIEEQKILKENIEKMLVSLKEDEENSFDFNEKIKDALEVQAKIEEQKKLEEQQKEDSSQEDEVDEEKSEEKEESKEEDSKEKEEDSEEKEKDSKEDEESEEKEESKEEKIEEDKKEEVGKKTKDIQQEQDIMPLVAYDLGPVNLSPSAELPVEEEIQPQTLLTYSVQTKQEVQALTSVSSTAQSFVDTYLTSSMGAIYTKANSTNYTNILSGLSSWNKLTASDRNQVNSILKSAVGKTYQNLLQEAQAIKAGYVDYSTISVNTATKNNANLWTLLMGLSASSMALLSKKRKKTNIE